jgi:hypothetical protein
VVWFCPDQVVASTSKLQQPTVCCSSTTRLQQHNGSYQLLCSRSMADLSTTPAGVAPEIDGWLEGDFDRLHT